MKKIKCVKIKFANSIEFNEIPAFRAAIAKLHPEESYLLHHHVNDKELLYRYPVIQYKVYNQKVHVLALEHGTDIILKLAEKNNSIIKIYRQKHELDIERLNLYPHTVQVWDKSFTYKIHNWLALNSENYQKFLHTFPLKERVKMLENILIAHILSFTEGIGYYPDKQICVTIHKIHTQKWISYKKIDRIAFDLTFETNISLPDYIGLGKSPSVGFGMVRKVKNFQKTDNEDVTTVENIETKN